MIPDPLVPIDLGVSLQVRPLLGSEEFRSATLELGLLLLLRSFGLILRGSHPHR
jgi:hypothetical protein